MHDVDRKTHILVVEDDEVDVKNVQRAFSRGNLTNPLYFAKDGLEALHMLRSEQVPGPRRIVLLDINMPGMNGHEFLRELRADPELRPIPVIVLTTSNDERDRFEAYDVGVAGYLLKPVTFAGFVEFMATMNRYWTLMEMP